MVTRRATAKGLGVRRHQDTRPACADHDPALFDTDSPRCDVDRAKAICGGCPVRQWCLQEGVAGAEFGIWGGTTEAERLEATGAARGGRRDVA